LVTITSSVVLQKCVLLTYFIVVDGDGLVAVRDTSGDTDRSVPQELSVNVCWVWSSWRHYEVWSSVPFVTNTVHCNTLLSQNLVLPALTSLTCLMHWVSVCVCYSDSSRNVYCSMSAMGPDVSKLA